MRFWRVRFRGLRAPAASALRRGWYEAEKALRAFTPEWGIPLQAQGISQQLPKGGQWQALDTWSAFDVFNLTVT
jgi:hypothetical protein